MPYRIFLLSPANAAGERARLVFNDAATFDLARRLRTPMGVPIGEVFAFLSGLYFRGKLTYARAFANPPFRAAGHGVMVITPNRGLLPHDTPMTIRDLKDLGSVAIDVNDRRYTAPLERDLHELHARARGEAPGRGCEFVLLGSIATQKYVDPLTAVLGNRLLFPRDFVGRGDMSRGGLLLRAARAGDELPYIPVEGAIRSGARPAKLKPVKRILKDAESPPAV